MASKNVGLNLTDQAWPSFFSKTRINCLIITDHITKICIIHSIENELPVLPGQSVKGFALRYHPSRGMRPRRHVLPGPAVTNTTWARTPVGWTNVKHRNPARMVWWSLLSVELEGALCTAARPLSWNQCKLHRHFFSNLIYLLTMWIPVVTEGLKGILWHQMLLRQQNHILTNLRRNKPKLFTALIAAHKTQMDWKD